MKTLITFVAILGVASAGAGIFGDALGEVTKAVVGGASGLAEGAAGLAGGAAGLTKGPKGLTGGLAGLAGGAKGLAGALTGLAGGAAGLAGGAAGIVVEGAAGLAKGAAQVVGKASDVLFGFYQHGKAEYAGIFQYYTNIGIKFFPNHGCCSCPVRGSVQPGYPNYSPHSPFFMNGVYQIYGTHFCTCPPELVASAVQAAHYNPGILGNIAHYVSDIHQLEAPAPRFE